MTSHPPPSSVDTGTTGASAIREARRKASERLGQWVRRKWRIDALLGVGGMAAVYAATHRNGSRVALKILHSEFARDQAVRDRFLREGYVANKVHHPGRVAILDDDETEDGEPLLVMELLEGQTLQTLWKKYQRRVPIDEAIRITNAVLDTLVPFHEMSIVHRDLKPANIFITDDDEVKILDFGVAKLREAGRDSTRAGTALGTPSFMSPEQAMGKTSTIDGRSDLYSLGATLYAILSGKRLHHGKSDNEAFILAATQPAPSLARVAPDLPVEAIAYVDKALQWDRRNRFQSAQEMARAGSELRARLQSGQSTPQSPRSVSPPRAEHAEKAQPAPTAPPDLDAVFKRLERLTPTMRQYGPDHPETRGKLRAFYRAVQDVLTVEPERVSFSVHPFCFAHNKHAVWEPSPPADAVVYNLCAAGLEHVQILPGVTEDEIRTFCHTILKGPGTIATDIAGELWEAQFEHIRCELRDDFAEVDAKEQERFLSEADDLLQTMGREDLAEAAAMALSAGNDEGSHRRTSEVALDMDPAERAALGAQLTLNEERWGDRFFELLAAAYADDLRQGLGVLAPHLQRFIAEQAGRGCFSAVFTAHRRLDEHLADHPLTGEDRDLGQVLTRHMFPRPTLAILLQELSAAPLESGGEHAALAPGMAAVLEDLGPAALDDVLQIADELPDGDWLQVVLDFVQMAAQGHEQHVIGLLDELRPRLAQRVLGAVLDATLQDARMLEPLLDSPNPVLRCEALARLRPRSVLSKELIELLDHGDAGVRGAALTTMVKHQVRSAGPPLVRVVESDGFRDRPPDEQRQVFDTLFALNAVRAEPLVAAIVEQHGLMADDVTDRTRTLAAEVLGVHGRSDEAIAALSNAQRRRPWNTNRLRDAATRALQTLLERRASQAGIPETT